ncbi:MAG: hypothetical protein AVDCRST_MAG88-1363, partial [uncultured Thermomicrobiales bacterium]
DLPPLADLWPLPAGRRPADRHRGRRPGGGGDARRPVVERRLSRPPLCPGGGGGLLVARSRPAHAPARFRRAGPPGGRVRPPLPPGANC